MNEENSQFAKSASKFSKIEHNHIMWIHISVSKPQKLAIIQDQAKTDNKTLWLAKRTQNMAQQQNFDNLHAAIQTGEGVLFSKIDQGGQVPVNIQMHTRETMPRATVKIVEEL